MKHLIGSTPNNNNFTAILYTTNTPILFTINTTPYYISNFTTTTTPILYYSFKYYFNYTTINIILSLSH